MTRRRLIPRYRDGNVTHLNAPKLFSPSAWPWIAWRATWWATKGEGLEWKPISLYRPYLDERMAIASPVLLRDATRWLYGSRVGNEWWRFSEGGSWPIDGFEPTLWCEPPLDDGTMLGRE